MAAMNDDKAQMSVVETQEQHSKDQYEDIDDHGLPAKYRGTAADQRDMSALGKTQVLRV